MKNFIAEAVIFFFLSLISANKISGCSSWEWDVPAPAHYSRASSVFIGTVRKIKRFKSDGDFYRATYFDVEKVYKGINEKELFTLDSGGMCQPEFKVGEKFIVFARRLENKHYLHTGMFEGTENVKKIEKEYIEYLDKVEKGIAEDTVSGKVIDYNSVKEGTENIKVELSNDNFNQTTKTDKNGRFKFTSIPTGKYLVTIHIPNAKYATSHSPDAKIIDAQEIENKLIVRYEIIYESSKNPYLMIFSSNQRNLI